MVDGVLYEVLKVSEIPLDYSSIAQLVEHAAVNRAVVGSSPTRGVFILLKMYVLAVWMQNCGQAEVRKHRVK